jgi:uncharacterized protein with HEPN domain
MRPEDRQYLEDMLDYAVKVRDRVADTSRVEFEADEDLQLILIILLQRVGEAARNVSRPARDLLPDVPWTDIIGMRHRLTHDYRHIKLSSLWQAATEAAPELIVELRSVLSADAGDS